MHSDLGPAVRAAVAVARRYGLAVTDPRVIGSYSNVMVHLRPHPVVARVAAAAVRARGRDAMAWLEREAAVIAYLGGRSAVAPAEAVPLGPHHEDGFPLLFLGFVEHRGHPPSSPEVVGATLRSLHAAMEGFPGRLPELGVLRETRGWLDALVADRDLPAADLVAVRDRYEQVRDEIAGKAWHCQALHGDAHLGNLLDTSRGPLWTDFEDVQCGPPEWDLAALVAGARVEAGRGAALLDRAVLAYGVDPASPGLALMVRARIIAAVAWELAAGRNPDGLARAYRRIDWLVGRGSGS